MGREFTSRVDLDRANWSPPDYFPVAYDELPNPPTHRDAIVNAFVHVHQSLHRANQRLAKRGQRTTAITPRSAAGDIGGGGVRLVTSPTAVGGGGGAGDWGGDIGMFLSVTSSRYNYCR